MDYNEEIVTEDSPQGRWLAEVWKLVWGPPEERVADDTMMTEVRRIASERTGYWPTYTETPTSED